MSLVVFDSLVLNILLMRFNIFWLHRSLMIQQMLRDLQTPLWLSGRADLNCNNEYAFQTNTLTFCSSLSTDYWQMLGITFRSWWPAPAQPNNTAAKDPEAFTASVIEIFKHFVSSPSPTSSSEAPHVQILNYSLQREGKMRAGCGSSITDSRFAETSSRVKTKGGGE